MRRSRRTVYEAVSCPNDWERYMLNIINNYSGEYFDDTYLQVCNNQEYFWMMTKYRLFSLSFYPMDRDQRVCIVGDRLGAITGAVCDRVSHVDTYLPTRWHADTVRKRYSDRSNLDIYTYGDTGKYDTGKYDSDKRDSGKRNPGKYDLCVVNFEYFHYIDPFTDQLHIENTFHRLADTAYSHLADHGILLVTAMGYDYELLKRLFYDDGFIYQHSFDPLGNGALVMELSRENNLLSGPDGQNLSFTDDFPLLESKWIRDNDYPYFGLDPVDQDNELIHSVAQVELDLMDKLLSVCKTHGLTIYPIYGTLLGTVRTGEVIAGDDDIDMAMPRADYDRLMLLAEEFDGKYFLQSVRSEDCFYGGYAKLRNRETTAIHPQNWWKDVCEGIAIDIFPLDRCFKDDEKELSRQKKIHFYQRLLYAKSYGYFPEFKDMKLLEWKSYVYLAKLYDRSKLVDRLEKALKSGDSQADYMISVHYHMGEAAIPARLPAKAFSAAFPMNYEGRSLQVPIGYEDILKARYGEGYIWSQGFNEYKQRHGFYSVDKPYNVYKKRFGGLKNPGSITEPIVLIGDGYLFKACLDYYKSRVNISHLVLFPDETDWLNDAAGHLPGTEKQVSCQKQVSGIRVETWEEFSALNLDRSSYRMIICAGDARRSEQKLEALGCEDYYIFWQAREWMLFANQSAVWKEVKKYL